MTHSYEPPAQPQFPVSVQSSNRYNSHLPAAMPQPTHHFSVFPAISQQQVAIPPFSVPHVTGHMNPPTYDQVVLNDSVKNQAANNFASNI